MTKPDNFKSHLLMDEVYPDISDIFSIKIKPLIEVKDTCLVVLDTNVLLVPYTVTKGNLDEIAHTYECLVEAKRLYIPGQVAREFVKLRPQKLTELHSQLTRRKVSLKKDSYPLLESVDLYRKLVEVEKELTTAVEEQNRKVDELLKHVRSWLWDDPVSKIYSRLFVGDVLFDLDVDKQELLQELERRKALGIPPGYKDAGKDTNVAGDSIIWQTILELAKRDHKDVLFVTSEEKADWWHRSENRALYPRFELVDEFRRASEGASFHILKLSELLELLGAKDETVAQVGQEERQYLSESEEVIYERDYTGYIPPRSELEGMASLYLLEKFERKVKVERHGGYPPLLLRYYNSNALGGGSYHFLSSEIGFSNHKNYVNQILSDAFFFILPYSENEGPNTRIRGSTFDSVLVTDSKEKAVGLYDYVKNNFVVAQHITVHICYLCGEQDIFICGYEQIYSMIH